jgi:hypothetical protein
MKRLNCVLLIVLEKQITLAKTVQYCGANLKIHIGHKKFLGNVHGHKIQMTFLGFAGQIKSFHGPHFARVTYVVPGLIKQTTTP